VPRLDGPLDLGTPHFAARRADPVAGILAAIRAGEAGDRVLAADIRWRGTRLRGAAWGLFARAELVALARGLPPAGLASVMEALLRYGWRATRGLPDLVVLPGAETKLAGAFPSILPGGVVLAEIKGPGDTLRPDQRIWADRLVRAGIRAEWWSVG
jgi:Fanconi-associated nuclease 1